MVKPPKGQTFAEMVDALPPTLSGHFVECVNRTQLREFTDASGVTWHRRGDTPIEGKPLRRLVESSSVRVLHEYLDEVAEVPGHERVAFWAEAEQRMDASAFSDFYGAEFKNAQREHLVVVHEDCQP